MCLKCPPIYHLGSGAPPHLLLFPRQMDDLTQRVSLPRKKEATRNMILSLRCSHKNKTVILTLRLLFITGGYGEHKYSVESLVQYRSAQSVGGSSFSAHKESQGEKRDLIRKLRRGWKGRKGEPGRMRILSLKTKPNKKLRGGKEEEAAYTPPTPHSLSQLKNREWPEQKHLAGSRY